MQKSLRLIARLIFARHECTHVRHCKENAPIYMYYVAPETPMMSSVIADCPDLVPPPNILDKSTPMHRTILDKLYLTFLLSPLNTHVQHTVHTKSYWPHSQQCYIFRKVCSSFNATVNI